MLEKLRKELFKNNHRMVAIKNSFVKTRIINICVTGAGHLRYDLEGYGWYPRYLFSFIGRQK